MPPQPTRRRKKAQIQGGVWIDFFFSTSLRWRWPARQTKTPQAVDFNFFLCFQSILVLSFFAVLDLLLSADCFYFLFFCFRWPAVVGVFFSSVLGGGSGGAAGWWWIYGWMWTVLLKLGRPVDAKESWWKTAEATTCFCGGDAAARLVGLRVVAAGEDGSHCRRKPICGSVVVSLSPTVEWLREGGVEGFSCTRLEKIKPRGLCVCFCRAEDQWTEGREGEAGTG